MPLASCGRNQADPDRNEARSLYLESREMIEKYIDSLKLAKDSATLLDLDERYEEGISDLNFKYNERIVLKVSEGENDSLTQLTLRYIHLRDSLLHRLSQPVLAADSVQSDSLPAASKSVISQRLQSNSSAKQ